MECASMELKPKYTSSRFNNHLIHRATEAIETASAEDLMNILQGFRKRASKDMYIKIRKTLIKRRSTVLPYLNNETSNEKNAQLLANFFYAFASNIPKVKGVYMSYFREDIDELLSHYEEDLKECPQYLDGDHVTRLAQALYILKTKEYETIFWRIEDRVNELKDKLTIHNVSSILRSFSHSQDNQMNGKDKTFFNLEPVILKNLDKLEPREATHLLYAYSVRNVGNPELYKALDNKLAKIASQLDYPGLQNAIYYMLFRENANEQIWKGLVEATVNQEDVLPLLHYKPFKASKLFLEHHFSKWDLTDYFDKFWYAERLFTVPKLEDLYYSDQRYENFKAFLNTKCFVYPISFVTINNLFMLHFIFNE